MDDGNGVPICELVLYKEEMIEIMNSLPSNSKLKERLALHFLASFLNVG